MQPLTREIFNQCCRAGIRQHANDLSTQGCHILQLSRDGERPKAFVGHTAPQEKGETRSELQVGNQVLLTRRQSRWLFLEAKQEAWIHQDTGKPLLDADFE